MCARAVFSGCAGSTCERTSSKYMTLFELGSMAAAMATPGMLLGAPQTPSVDASALWARTRPRTVRVARRDRPWRWRTFRPRRAAVRARACSAACSGPIMRVSSALICFSEGLAASAVTADPSTTPSTMAKPHAPGARDTPSHPCDVPP